MYSAARDCTRDIVGYLRGLRRNQHRRYRDGRFSQQAVADRTGTTQSAISDLETGRTAPMFTTLCRLFRALYVRATLVIWDGDRIDQIFELGAASPVAASRLVAVKPQPLVRSTHYAPARWEFGPVHFVDDPALVTEQLRWLGLPGAA